MPLFEQLREKYADHDVTIVHIYVREPHPEERAFKQYTQHADYEQKMAYARELVELKAVTVPVVVDEMDEAINQLLGGLPNTIWVIDKVGDIRYKSTWADVDKADRALAELVSADDPNNPVEPTFETQHVSDKI